MMQTQLVKKAAIIDSGDFNLSAARYLEKVEIDSDYEFVKLKEICIIQRGGSPRPINDYITNDPNGFNWIKIGDAKEGDKYINSSKQKIKKEGINKSRKVEIGDFILSNSMSFGRPYIMKIDGFIHDGWLLLKYNEKLIEEDYLYYILRSENVKNQFIIKATGGVVNNLNKELVSSVKIPLPPLEIQEQIVKEIEGYQQIIDGCRQVVENYKPVIDIDPSWEKVKLNEISEVIMGQSPKSVYYNDNNQGLPFYQGKTHFGDRYLKKHSTYTSKITKESNQGDIVMSVRAPVGSVNLTPFKICIGRGLCAIRPKNIVDLTYIYYYLQQDDVIKGDMGATYESINREKINETEISYPKNRFELAEKLEQEKEVIEGNKELIKIYENKINARINKVWSDN